MKPLLKVLASLFAVSALTLASWASTFGAVGGTASAPVSSPNGISYTAFPTITGSGSISSVASPLGGDVGFNYTLQSPYIGSGWATWSNGYTGSVYTDYASSNLTLTLPTGTTAFYFYAEPNLFNVYQISAIADGVTISQSINGVSGASLFQFYTDGTSFLSTIVVQADPLAQGFAVGEFGISNGAPGVTPVPEPSTYGLMGASALVGVAFLRRRKQRSA